jgi:hypothetical protein
VASAIAHQEFMLDCIALELNLIEAAPSLWGLTPFFTVPDTGVVVAFGYWSPGETSIPHEHTAWTITAVCQNELAVRTFDRHESYRRGELVPKNEFRAVAGSTGYIYDPSIHQPRNNSHKPAMSLHLISPRDGEPAPDGDGPWAGRRAQTDSSATREDHAYRHVLRFRHQQNHVREQARYLASMQGPGAADLATRCYSLGNTATRRLIAGTTGRTDLQSRGPWLLRRVHKDLNLRHRRKGDRVVLEVETERGMREELRLDPIASKVMQFVANQLTFDVAALPGGLSREECALIGETLEEAGLFRRVNDDERILWTHNF